MKISGSVYSDKNRSLKETILDLQAHQVDYLHVDCNDDIAVFEDIENIRKWSNLPIDLHIITPHPEMYFEGLRQHPVDFMTFQYEPLTKRLEIPSDITGKKGLSIVTPTPIEVFKDYTDFDFVLFMATVPGQSGGVFDSKNFNKIRAFKHRFPNIDVHVDGGVNGEVSFILRNMGIHASVSGSFLFKGASVGQALMDLTKRNLKSQFKVRDFMIPIEECPVIELKNARFFDVLKTIDDGKQGFTIVTKEGDFKGIISNADVRKAMLREFENWPNIELEGLVNTHPVVIDAEANVEEMLELIREKTFPIMYLPVIDKKHKPEGIVTFINLIKGEI